jgi:hypothetical protein
MDRQLGDAFVLACDAERLLLDLAPDLVKVDETLVEVEELAPFVAVAAGRVDQLEDERSARHDALAARQEIAPDDAELRVCLGRERKEMRRRTERSLLVQHLLFEHTGFTCGLAANL